MVEGVRSSGDASVDDSGASLLPDARPRDEEGNKCDMRRGDMDDWSRSGSSGDGGTERPQEMRCPRRGFSGRSFVFLAGVELNQPVWDTTRESKGSSIDHLISAWTRRGRTSSARLRATDDRYHVAHLRERKNAYDMIYVRRL